MLRTGILLLTALVAASVAIRCFSSQTTVPGPSSNIVTVNCPQASFCFKSYVERNTRGDNSYTETRTCGNIGTCFEEGCRGKGDDRQCCCIGDQCNGAMDNGMTKIALLVLATFVFIAEF